MAEASPAVSPPLSPPRGTVANPRVAVLGAGPTGLEAALAAAEAGFPFNVYEAGRSVAGHVREWGHVRLFTPWSLNLSARMGRALAAAGVAVPEGDVCPTGAELVARLLEPVARLAQVAPHMRYGVEVRGLGRRGLLKHEEIGSAERASRPFRLLLTSGGREWSEEADVVLDCTGSSRPKALGDGGLPALGETSLDGRLHRQVPNLGRDLDAWAEKSVLLVGAGHSAQTAVVDLVELADENPATRVVWVLRGARVPEPIEDDPLPERAALTGRAAALAAAAPECLRVMTDAVVEELAAEGDGVAVVLARGDGSRETFSVDRVLALTGRVGDHLLYRELQVHECYATSGPMKLAAALLAKSGATGGDCLAQTSQGVETLKNPEPGFFILGQKSYGRRNDFLMRVGWQQVDEVFELLRG